MHEEEHSSEEDDEDELALLTKNSKKFLKKVGKSSKFGHSFPKKSKGKNPSAHKILIFLIIKKRIKCKECEGFGHIHFECTNTQKKKNKALKST